MRKTGLFSKKAMPVFMGLMMSLGMGVGSFTMNATGVQAEEVNYTRNAVIMDADELPGVYETKAVVGDGYGDAADATIGIPSVAKQTLSDQPTKESPAIIMGAAVNYEKRTGPTEFTPFVEGTERVAPYSYFRHGIIDEQVQDADGNVTTHKKLSGFDGSYYIVRVDVSDIIAGATDDQYLHVRQDSNKALMVAVGFDGTTYSDALGSKTGSYSLANAAKALKDNGLDSEIPYFDVIILSSGKLAAGADAGQENAPSADIKLSFYVDDTVDYHPELVALDPNNPPTFPYTVGGTTYQAETDYNNALLTKYFEEANATAENNAAKYIVKGSDLEIDVMVDEQESPDGVNEFWSLTNAIAYPQYDSHVVKLICEVPVLEGLSIEGSSDNKRSVILDVNSFDIQIANSTEQNKAGLVIGGDSELRIMDGSNTAGAELAIGNNATMVVKNGGTLIIDESCTGEVEYDAASITDPTQQPAAEQINGEITIEDGGKLINYGVVNIEGMEAKPQPQDPEQQQQEQVIRDMRPAYLLVKEGGELENYGCISVKGNLYILGTLTNHGKYTDLIDAYDPDKGIVPYHKGIQLTWKDDVRNPEVVPGAIYIGIDADENVTRTASLINDGDIVIVPGVLNVYGSLENTGNIYLADVTEAVVPIQPSKEAPLVTEIRVDVDPMRPGLIVLDKDAEPDVAEGSVKGATVKVVSNGRLGDMTASDVAVGDASWIKAGDFVIEAKDGEKTLKAGTDFTLKDGGVDFSEKYLNTFFGTRTVTMNIGYREYSFEVTGTAKGVWEKTDAGWTYIYATGGSAKNKWESINGKYYYFDADGIMESDAYRNGYYLTKSGAWDGKKPLGTWKKSSKGWWYSLGGSNYLADTWKKIDGKWYYFKSSGYMAAGEFVKGYWLERNGVWKDTTRYSWHKTAKGWWYGVSGGWYAKSTNYTIDGKAYSFASDGYQVNLEFH